MALKEKKFAARLSSHSVVPPFYSGAGGDAEFTATAEYIEFSVNAPAVPQYIEFSVTAGYIHSGKKGENGPIVVTLFKNESPTNGVLETGSITADKLEGPMAGKQLTDLVTAMNNGEIYVNVTSEKYPHGEVRGQIRSSDGQ
jgi:CHRD domain